MKTPSAKSVTGSLIIVFRDCIKYDGLNAIKLSKWDGSNTFFSSGKDSSVSLNYSGGKLWICLHNELNYSPYSVKSYTCKDPMKVVDKALNYVLWEERCY